MLRNINLFFRNVLSSLQQQCEARLSSIVVSTSRCGRDDLSSILRKGINFCSFVVAAVVVLCFASVSIGPLVVACAPLFCFLS